MGLQKSIFQTLAYFDIFDLPLTKEELLRLLYTEGTEKVEYIEFLNQLNQLCSLPGVVERSRGFYFLSGREGIVDERQRKVKIVEQKMKIAKRGIKKIAWVPFLRAVFVCNTVAFGSADEGSDIDVLIVVRKGRIWLTRLLATLSLSLFGLRRTKNKIKNRICLSFYLADDCLNLEKIAIESDIYLTYWLAQLIPVYDPDNLHRSIVRANKWVNKYLVNGVQAVVSSKQYAVNSGRMAGWFKKLLEKMWGWGYGDMIESQAKAIQQARMKMNLHSVQNAPDTRVVVSDSMLKFHEKDKREEYREEWVARVNEITNNQDTNNT